MSELEARLSSYEPTIRAPRLVGDVTYALHETAVGRLLLAAGPRGLVASSYAASDDDEHRVATRLANAVSPRVVRGTSPMIDEARRELDGYFAGQRRSFDAPVDPALLTPFQSQVLLTLAGAVGYGSTTTYGELARLIGNPRAARAVGAALGANPVCIVLPCHRVIGRDGSLTGYAGGVPAKRLLLELEAASASA